MKNQVNKPLTDKTFKGVVAICLEQDPVNGLFNVEPYGMMPDWDVSLVTNMSYAFYKASLFNGNINNWDTSNVTSMYGMFDNASAFNQNIGSWDVSSVIDMRFMFNRASNFNQDLSEWDVSRVTGIFSRFSLITSYSQSTGEWGFEHGPIYNDFGSDNAVWKLPKPNFINPYK